MPGTHLGAGDTSQTRPLLSWREHSSRAQGPNSIRDPHRAEGLMEVITYFSFLFLVPVCNELGFD